MDIDFILTWVDGNDPQWQAEKAKYAGTAFSDAGKSRYRDWDTLRFWFRGVEKFAPWVHKVYFVTCGHVPDWLNLDHPKLELVRHSDYIPAEWLPTFSSRTIDMNFHRIAGLAEHFVYFNDDMFLISATRPEDFFVNGLPCDTAIENAHYMGARDITTGRHRALNKTYLAPILDTIPINGSFDKKEVLRKNFGKWFTMKYGFRWVRTLLLSPWRYFTGFMDYHLPYSYLKSNYEELWSREEKLLASACRHRFREAADLNHWAFTYWQLAKGTFYPRSPALGRQYGLVSDDTKNQAAYEAIRRQRLKVVCVNDEIEDGNFELVKARLKQALEEILPEKSAFER